MLLLKGLNDSLKFSLEDDEGQRVVNSCEGDQCCNIQLDKPYHVYKETGKTGRTFQKRWFKEYGWLTYCHTHNVTYCFYCRKGKLQARMSHI